MDQEIISAKWVEMLAYSKTQSYSKADVLMSAIQNGKQYRCRHCQSSDDFSRSDEGPFKSDHTTANCRTGPRPSGWRKS